MVLSDAMIVRFRAMQNFVPSTQRTHQEVAVASGCFFFVCQEKNPAKTVGPVGP